jgi:hypothetical protein
MKLFGDAISVKKGEESEWLHGYLTKAALAGTNGSFISTKEKTGTN